MALFTDMHRTELSERGFTVVRHVIPVQLIQALLTAVKEATRIDHADPWWRNVPGQQDPEPGSPPKLTHLGARLVGMEPW